MANTYTLIASSTVGAGGVANITFSSIPSTYTDLCVKYSIRSSGNPAATYAYLTFNGSSATAYSMTRLYGFSSTVASSSSSATSSIAGAFLVNGSDETGNTFGNGEIYIPNYASSNYKSVSGDTVDENNGSVAFRFLASGLWSNTSAITSITLTGESTNFAQYSTAYLYGIKNS
jgi:hypothetical protein